MMNEPRLTRLELFKEQMNFSAGHFTIFSATERENMHGHNFFAHVAIESDVAENGMASDYGIYKKAILDLCRSLDHAFLLPTQNSYLRLEEDNQYVYAYFNADREKIPFLKRDVKLLPIRNVTLEELSFWFLGELLLLIKDQSDLVESMEVKIFSGPGQSGLSSWKKSA